MATLAHDTENWIWLTDSMGAYVYEGELFVPKDYITEKFDKYTTEQGPMLFDAQYSYLGYLAIINEHIYSVLNLRWDLWTKDCSHKDEDGICSSLQDFCVKEEALHITPDKIGKFGCRSGQACYKLIHAYMGELLAGLENYPEIILATLPPDEESSDWPWAEIFIATPPTMVYNETEVDGWVGISNFYAKRFPCSYNPGEDEDHVKNLELFNSAMGKSGIHYPEGYKE